MNTHADKNQENKSQSVPTSESQIQGGADFTFLFADISPEAVVQKKLQEIANNSSQVSQLRAYQDIANNSPQTKHTTQLQAMVDNHSRRPHQPIQLESQISTESSGENNTGLPDNLKTGMELLSGISLDDVQVHRNSPKPAQLQAHAYAQGSDIHLGPGQEKHLPHEIWHVIQQKQGRVKPTMQMKGRVDLNDDAGLEKEADLMGAKAVSMSPGDVLTNYHSDSSCRYQKVTPFSHNVLQAKMKAKNFRELVIAQRLLQTEVKKNPGKYKGNYTTVGFEHEFADMASGPLRGASHIEVAKSVEKMPYTGLRFILETDAQNALEFVSPPFLVETLPGIPLPDPDDVEQIDGMISDTLAHHTNSDPNLRELIYKFMDDPGLTFRTGNLERETQIDSHEFPEKASEDLELHGPVKRPKIQGSNVKIHRENMSGVTEGVIGGKGITKGNSELAKDDLLDIKLQSFAGEGSKKKSSSQVNFATDARTYDMMQSLSSTVKKGTEEFVALEEAFRLEFYKEAFKEDIEDASAGRTVAEDLLDQITQGFVSLTKNATSFLVQFRIKASTSRERVVSSRNVTMWEQGCGFINDKLQAIRKKLNSPYDISDIQEDAKTMAQMIQKLMEQTNSAVDEYKENQLKDRRKNEFAEHLKEDQAQINKSAQAFAQILPKLASIGNKKGDDNLKIFLNSLARKLAGQLGVNAQKIMKAAQNRRFKKAYKIEEGKIGGKEIGKSGLLTSRVKDVHQVWIKDTIMNIGLGLLNEGQWGRVKTLIEGNKIKGSFRSKYVGSVRAAIKNMELPVKLGGDFPSQKDFTNMVDNALSQIVSYINKYGLDDHAKKSGSKKRAKISTKSGFLSIGPSKRPDLFDHNPKFIGARQDTYLPAKNIQMPEIWKGKRLHVTESRGNMKEMIERMREMKRIYESGESYSASSFVSFDYEDFMQDSLKDGEFYLGNGYTLKKAQADKLLGAGLENVNTVPDGDCLFNSLITVGAHAGDVSVFRNLVADRINDDTVDISGFGLDKVSTVADIRRMGSYNNLSGDVTPSIIANVLNAKIIIYNENGSTTTLDGGAGGPYHLIRFTSPGAHYHATRVRVPAAVDDDLEVVDDISAESHSEEQMIDRSSQELQPLKLTLLTED